MSIDFSTYTETRIPMINRYVEESVSQFRGQVSQRLTPLIDSMQYSLDGGGKRLRPLLAMATAECVGLKPESILPAACAIEYIHTYSLIHDDLPALDDDDTRRGKPSNHKRFGEAVAILTGDALLTESFGQMKKLADAGKYGAFEVLEAFSLLVHYSGVRGMVGGQFLDVTSDPVQSSLPEVEFIHIHKTGAMILASVLIPVKLAKIDEPRLKGFKRFGEAIGLAFQISDDLLDAESSIRYSRGPRKKPKPSYAQLMSPVETREKMNGLVDAAIHSLRGEAEKAAPLICIAEYIRSRRR